MAEDRNTDKIFDELVRGKEPEEILGKEGVRKHLTKRLVERTLEGEMATHLVYEKNAREGRNSGNSRNGKTTKEVKGDFGEVEIQAPRDRNGQFEPKLVEKGQRRLPGFDSSIRNVTTKRGAFPTPDSVRKVLHIAIQRRRKKWNRPIGDWPAALNHFAMVFEGRVPN
jgi:transposase-like protein